MTTIALTGASGLIGRALHDELRARGDRVVTFVRRPARGADEVQWDPTGSIRGDDLSRVGRIDGVVHLAGAGIADRRWSASRKDEILSSRTLGTDLLARVLSTMATPPSRVVIGSAIGFYGSRGDQVLTEADGPGEGFLAEVCVAWEAAALPLVTAGVPVAFARTGIVQSARGGALAKQLPLFRAGLGGRLSSGKQWMSPISLRDEVRALLFLLDEAAIGPFNLVAPTPVTNHTFTSALARLVHRPAVATVPAVALRLALGAELTSEALLASQRVAPQALESAGFIFEHPTIDAILADALTY
jgi:uncharacterized protein